MSDKKMVSRVWSKKQMQDVKKQFAALGTPLMKSADGSGYYLSAGGVDYFRAMIGRNSYLVRYVDGLFSAVVA